MEKEQTNRSRAAAARDFLLYGGLSREEFREISDEIQKSNRKSMKVYTAVASAFLAVMVALSFVSADAAVSRGLYFATMLTVMILFAASGHLSGRHPWVLLVSIYVFIGVLYSFGIILGTITRPEEQTVTFVALLLTVPLLFVDHPLRMGASIALFALAFVAAAAQTKERQVLVADVINVTVFAAISMIVSSYMMRMKCQRILFEQRALALSQTDVLTGLNNRNFFERNLLSYPARCGKSLACVFVDVDGLHELNNTQGHAAGDRMLQFVAEQMRAQFGAEHTYRIGGDEFVAFAPDCPPRMLTEQLGVIRQTVETRGYQISIGCAEALGDKIDMTNLVRDAETEMYEAKKRYYAEKGIARNIR